MIIKGKSQRAILLAVAECPDLSSAELADKVTTEGRTMSRSASRRCLGQLSRMDLVEPYESTQTVVQRCRRYKLSEAGQEWIEQGQRTDCPPVGSITGSLGLRQRQMIRLLGRDSKLISREEIRERLGLTSQTARLAVSSLIRLELLTAGEMLSLSLRGRIWWISDRVQRGQRIKPSHLSDLWEEWK